MIQLSLVRHWMETNNIKIGKARKMEKKNLIWIAVIVAAVLGAFIVATNSNTLSGTYSREIIFHSSYGDELETYSLEFNEDGKVRAIDGNRIWSGEYEREGKNLTMYITVYQIERRYTGEIQGNRISVDGWDSIAGTYTKD